MREYSFSDIICLNKEGLEVESNINIRGKSISSLSKKSETNFSLKDLVASPAFINAHDHLLGSYWPKVGHGPYRSWYPWDLHLKSSKLYEERSKISNEDLYYIGSYRNLLSGALTVSDHIPHVVNDEYIPKMPIRIIKDYALAHEVSSYELTWGEGVDKEYAKALENDIPFVTHLEEGFDRESRKGTEYLMQKNAISDHSVLVHCIALTLEDIKTMAKKNANLVWCAASNWFMFRKTARVKEWLNEGINVSIGTDSPMSGGETLLSEMRFCKELYENVLYPNEELSYESIIKMVTQNPAKAFRLKKLGAIEKNYIADIIMVENNKGSGHASFVEAELKDIMLIISNGNVVYADEKYKEIIEHFNDKIYKIKVEGKVKYTIFDIKALMLRIRKALGFAKEIVFLPVE